MKVIRFLRKPYPYDPPTWGRSLRLATGIGSFIAVFLMIFQPFGLEQIPSQFRLLYILGYGGITFTAILIFQMGVKRIFRGFFKEESWTTGKEMIENLGILLLIGMGNYTYTLIIGGTFWSFSNFIFFLMATVAVGIFPITILVFLSYAKVLKNNLMEAQIMEMAIQKRPLTTDLTIVRISSKYQQEDLSLPLSALLWISSADNYAEVVSVLDGKIKKSLVRTTLSELEESLSAKGILRTHRSYMVNLNLVIHIEGNAQGYQLFFEGFEQAIPVSRKYAPQVKAWLKK
ncbi:MAG: LytR/AlgR family response regulator transcription factor [Cecembia sp.]